jgi:Zn-dependent alcohol dehydrogenase
MNRKQKRASGSGSVMATSKLKQEPTHLLVGCVGVGSKACGQAVAVPYAAFSNADRLFTALQGVNWFMGVTEGDAPAALDVSPKLVHSILCTSCADTVLRSPSPGIGHYAVPGSTQRVEEE